MNEMDVVEYPTVCLACGEALATIDVGGMSPDFKACFKCFRRYGKIKLAAEADRMLVLISEHPKFGKCLHCGAQVLVNPKTGAFPVQCTECDQELLRLMAAQKRKSA